MGEGGSTSDEQLEQRTTRGKVTKRVATQKKTPAPKKSKTSPIAKSKSKSSTKSPVKAKKINKDDAKVLGHSEPETSLKEPPRSEMKESADNCSSRSKSASPVKMSIEEKRKALQAERLRKEKEMQELLEQEKALLEVTEEEENLEPTDMETRDTSVEKEDLNISADSNYDTRSEIDESHDDEFGKEEDFESMDDMAMEESADIDQSGEAERSHDEVVSDGGNDVDADSHVPPVEGGLAGLDDDEELADEPEVESKERAISPVTWDVDVHANQDDDNISVDSPLNSDDESESDGGEVKEDEVSDKPPQSETAEKTSTKISTTPSEQVKAERLSAHSRLSTDAMNERTERTKGVESAEAMRPRVHKYLYREAKYFMVKSSNHENVRLAKAKGVWSTPPQNEIRFNKAVEENTTVILVFSVKESGAFQGFARINGPSQKDGPKIAWVLPPGISAKALSGVFKLDWISRTDLAFTKTGHLRNPWNQNKPVKIARDGQEIETHSGESLCKLFTLDGSSDYERVISRVKRKREALQAKGPLPTNRAPYRPNPSHSNHYHGNQPHSHPSSRDGRDGHSDYRGRGRGLFSYRGGGYRGSGSGYRGGRGGSGGGYRDGPPPHSGSSYSSPRYHQSMSSGPRSGHPSQPPQYYTSSSRSSYNNGTEYRDRSSYPSAPAYPQSQPPSYHSAPAVPADIFVKGSYEQYLDQMRRAPYIPDLGSSMAMYDPYSASYHAGGRDAPPPPPIPSYSSSRDRDRDRGSRPSADRYDRAVEDFLRRTGGSSSSRSGRSSDHRYKESRDASDSREYRRRSRSRERDRHRGDRR